jgi:hypothetical protein
VAILAGALLFCGLTSGIATIPGYIAQGRLAMLLIFLLLQLILYGGIGGLCIWGVKRIEGRRSQQPKPMVVILPDGIVGYQSKKVWALAFSDVTHMQFRMQQNWKAVSVNDTWVNVPTTPTVCIDLIYRGGQRGTYTLWIPPQEIIAQQIIEAHRTFQAQYPPET